MVTDALMKELGASTATALRRSAVSTTLRRVLDAVATARGNLKSPATRAATAADAASGEPVYTRLVVAGLQLPLVTLPEWYRQALRHPLPSAASGGNATDVLLLSPFAASLGPVDEVRKFTDLQLDFWMLVAADVFVANQISTLSVNVCRRRLAGGRPCDNFVPLPAEPDEATSSATEDKE